MKRFLPKRRQKTSTTSEELKKVLINAIKMQAIASWGKIQYTDSTASIQ